MAATDLTGQRFGKLVVLRKIGRRPHAHTLWLCVCDCGRHKTVDRGHLTQGYTRSCGCARGVNEFTHLADGSTLLTITRVNGEQFQCFIDTADYDRVRLHRWFVHKGKHTYYAATNSTKDGLPFRESLHRLILTGTIQIDHKDRDGLNNRRANLRPATQSLNNGNQRKRRDGVTSKYRGVSWNTSGKKFVANITVDNKQKYLGSFDSEEAAAIMYNIFAKMYFGEFASLNQFPDITELGVAA